MKILKVLAAVIDALNLLAGKIASWFTLFLVSVVFSDVVGRYVFNYTYVFILELEWHIFGFIFFMGAGHTLLKDKHVRVEVIYGSLTPKGKAWVNIVGVLFFLIPSCYMLMERSLDFVYRSWKIMEFSPNPGGLPFRFIPKSFIPVGYALLLLQGISMGIRSLFVLTGRESQEIAPDERK